MWDGLRIAQQVVQAKGLVEALLVPLLMLWEVQGGSKAPLVVVQVALMVCMMWGLACNHICLIRSTSDAWHDVGP